MFEGYPPKLQLTCCRIDPVFPAEAVDERHSDGQIRMTGGKKVADFVP